MICLAVSISVASLLSGDEYELIVCFIIGENFKAYMYLSKKHTQNNQVNK
jgi:hypothetical protein